jgi:hypothetical protein
VEGEWMRENGYEIRREERGEGSVMSEDTREREK